MKNVLLGSNDLPVGWALASLEDVCNILDSMRIPVNNTERQKRIAGKSGSDLYPYYGATGQVGVIDDYIFDGEHVLIGEDGAPFLDSRKNKAYMCRGKFWVNNHAHILKSSVSNRFLCHSLNHVDYSKFVTGTTRLKLNQAALRAIPLPFPPKTEQHRIVAKIEELFSELDKGIENLQTAKKQLEVYRQAVLKHAFEGKLTEKWREDHRGKLETTKEVLERIASQRKQQYEAQLGEWQTAVEEWEEGGKKGPKPRKPAKYKQADPISDQELAALPRIATEWQFVRLSEIAEVGSGMSVSKSRKLADPVEVPYLRVANVQRGFLDLGEIKSLPIEKSQLSSLALKKWDVLFNEGGDRDKLGRGWIWQSEVDPCITQNHVFRASLYFPSEANAKVLSHWGNTFGQRYFEETGKQTTNLASINKTVLSKFPLPLISEAEQQEISSRLDQIMSVIDEQEIEVADALQRCDVLRQSILKRAFAGQLVEQDPSDEPASVMLERIRAAKAKIDEVKKAGKSKWKKKAKKKSKKKAAKRKDAA